MAADDAGGVGGLGAVFRWVYEIWKNGIPGGGGAVHGPGCTATGGISGKVFYVDGINGLDTNQGTKAGPWKTIRKALNECTDYHDDYILVKDCWQQEDPLTGWPIMVDVKRVHIIGIANPNNQYPKMQPPDNTAVFQITNDGEYSEIAGFDLSGGGVHGGIELSYANGAWIHHCWFGSDFAGGAPQYGINFLLGPNGGVLIEYCRFLGDGMSKGKISDAGIFMANVPGVACDNSMIRHCLFQSLPTNSILLRRAIGVAIQDNDFALATDTEGLAILLSSTYEGCEGCLVSNNRAQFGEAGMARNPYLDQNVANSNHWTYNWSGNALVYPA